MININQKNKNKYLGKCKLALNMLLICGLSGFALLSSAVPPPPGNQLSVQLSCIVEGTPSNPTNLVCYAFVPGNTLPSDQIFWNWDGLHSSLQTFRPSDDPVQVPTLVVNNCLEPGIATVLVQRGVNQFASDTVAVDCTSFNFNFGF